jgi:arylsulfatase A-like enzyme
MDNLGYGELGVYGGGALRGAPTPRIDKLAAEGTRLTSCARSYQGKFPFL